MSGLPQALASGFASRVREGGTTLYMNTTPMLRSARHSTAVNYAEFEEDFDANDFEDDDDEEGSQRDSREGSEEADGDDDGPKKEEEDKYAGLKAPLESNEPKRAAPPVRPVMYPQEVLEELAKVKEPNLVPIRVAVENIDVFRVQDFFLWDADEKILTPEQFATLTCADLDVPIGYSAQMSAQIKKQLAEFTAAPALPKDVEVHVIVELAVTVDKIVYEDKFEWDLSGDYATPQEFARTVVQDLGLGQEFYPAITYQLYETLSKLQKAWLERTIPLDVDNRAAFGLEAGLRVDVDNLGESWVPRVEEMTPEEMQKREMERDRSSRRLKRESARMAEVPYVDLDSLYSRKRRRRFDEDSRSGSPMW
ncbi:Chromatin structure-remodeling complex subunit SFH1 [Yarrowia sp. C11]|nr:Chromatin structure-remodeling complex subunit SFH1 [Yarrowia sp. E02]KAG5369242.1 Chromatin structure-remodeling complex subunit SFH1 [Yarrowia sp. C11]